MNTETSPKPLSAEELDDLRGRLHGRPNAAFLGWPIARLLATIDAQAQEIAELRWERERLAEQLERMRAALQEIKDRPNQVCEEFELCNHRACQASYTAFAIADVALSPNEPAPDPDECNCGMAREGWNAPDYRHAESCPCYRTREAPNFMAVTANRERGERQDTEDSG